MAETTSIVRVTDVYKTFQLGKVEVKALQGINLEIPRGKGNLLFLKDFRLSVRSSKENPSGTLPGGTRIA